jgi:cyclase
VPELMKSRAKPDAPPPTLPDKTFPDTWRQDLGDEVVSAKFYGPAHTGGDIVVLFEKANVVHMGDLVFNRMQPFIDRPGGASIQGWITLLEQVAKAHGDDTIFVFGHAGEKFPVTGGKADLRHMGSFLTALLEFTRKAKQAGQTREAFVKTTAPVPGFDDYGPLLERVTGAAFDEVQ